MRRAVAIVILILAGTVKPAVGQTPNWVQTKTYVDSVGQVFGMATSYTDGLGRDLLSRVDLDYGSYDLGLVVGKTYDDAGRLSTTTVPFVYHATGFCADAFDSANTARGGEPEAGNHCYSEIYYKPDPLGRPHAVGAPGVNYSIAGGHPSRNWNLGTSLTGADQSIIGPGGFVTAEALSAVNPETLLTRLEWGQDPGPASPNMFLTVTKGSNPGEYSQQMKDLFGNTVATCSGVAGIVARNTYDILGNLLTETPPDTSVARQSDQDNDMATTYSYNTLGQMIYKYTPDAGNVEYLYDGAGRLAYSMNYLQAYEGGEEGDQFTVYLYDDLGRNTYIGTNESDASFYALPAPAANATPMTPDQLRLKIRNIYDDPQALCVALGMAQGDVDRMSLRNLRGRLVASIAYDESNESNPAKTDIFQHVVVDIYSYDDEGRVEAKYKRTPLMPNFAKRTYAYDVQGHVLNEQFWEQYALWAPDQFYPAPGAPSWSKSYVYDRLGRLLSIIDGNSSTPEIITYAYDNYGRLQNKYFGLQGTPTASVIYSYNIRDWTTQIASVPFIETIKYSSVAGVTVPTGKTAPTAQYNGNIAFATVNQATLPTGGNAEATAYTYDGVNRLIGVSSYNDGTKDESFTYLNDGRISTRTKGTNPAAMTYGYLPGKHQVHKIQSLAGRESANNYKYDPNGNMVLDCYKKMLIDYDWRDMPWRFTFYDMIPGTVAGAAWDLSLAADIRSGGGKAVKVVTAFYDAAGNRVLKNEVNVPEL